ncbi:MAG: PDZ domain-containing protein [Permianibacter sp.]
MKARLPRLLTALALVPVLWLGAFGSADDVVYQESVQPERRAPVASAGSGGAYVAGSSSFAVTVQPGQLGVAVANLSGPDQLFYKRETGAIVEQVAPNSPAAKAGIFRNDVILAVDDQPVLAAADVVRLMQGNQPGGTKVLRVLRDGAEKNISVQF